MPHIARPPCRRCGGWLPNSNPREGRIRDFDLLLWAGDKYKAFDAKIPVEVTGTTITIEFFGEKCCGKYLPTEVNSKLEPVAAKCRTGVAKVNAILVEDFVFSPEKVFAINSGSLVPADSLGITYDADNYSVLGQTYSTIAPISGTSDGTVYQTERYGAFSYAIPTGNGTFNVLLKFAEIYKYIYQGARQIAVDIEGKKVITGLDLYSLVGLYQAYDFFVPFPVTVKGDGMLNIDGFVKSQKSRHSCESRSPELFELTGFPLSRE